MDLFQQVRMRGFEPCIMRFTLVYTFLHFLCFCLQFQGEAPAPARRANLGTYASYSGANTAAAGASASSSAFSQSKAVPDFFFDVSPLHDTLNMGPCSSLSFFCVQKEVSVAIPDQLEDEAFRLEKTDIA
jgi:hypothetical protein